METKYTYVVTDFPNHKVASNRFTVEIQSSAIITALDHIDTNEANCDTWFKDILSSGDKAILDGIVAAHSGEPLTPELPTQPVRIIDTQNLDPSTALSCTEFIEVQVETGVPVSEALISYPFSVDVAAARYVMEDSRYEYGDKFDVFGIPEGDPAIGGVTAPAAQGDTSVSVSPTVFQYARAGMYLKFQGHAGEYRIESMDSALGTVELMAPLGQAVVPGETIHVRRPFLINGWVCKNVVYAIGDLSSGSSSLNAGDMMRIRYYHKTTPTADYVLPFAMAMMF